MISRRPIKARGSAIVQSMATAMARSGVTPNQVSVASMFCAGGACLALLIAPVAPWQLIVSAVFVQMRLMCNLLDGLIAVEGGKKTAVGEIFNEVPDRVSDTAILVGAGYVCGQPLVGLWAALGAMATAYMRAFGAQCTGVQDFGGPMAKQHRMFVITVALVASALLPAYMATIIFYALCLICAGCVLTCLRRLLHIASELKKQHSG